MTNVLKDLLSTTGENDRETNGNIKAKGIRKYSKDRRQSGRKKKIFRNVTKKIAAMNFCPNLFHRLEIHQKRHPCNGKWNVCHSPDLGSFDWRENRSIQNRSLETGFHD